MTRSMLICPGYVEGLWKTGFICISIISLKVNAPLYEYFMRSARVVLISPISVNGAEILNEFKNGEGR